MDTAKLTLRLPTEDADFIKAYAKEHGVSVSSVLNRFVQRLKAAQSQDIHPDIYHIAGIVPQDVDTKTEYHSHLLEKHR